MFWQQIVKVIISFILIVYCCTIATQLLELVAVSCNTLTLGKFTEFSSSHSIPMLMKIRLGVEYHGK